MGSTAQMVHLEAISDREASSAASEVKTMASSLPPGTVAGSHFTWEKLSPSEFQQLQDFAACEYDSFSLCQSSVVGGMLQFDT